MDRYRDNKILFSIDRIMLEYKDEIQKTLNNYFKEATYISGGAPHETRTSLVLGILKRLSDKGEKGGVAGRLYKTRLDKWFEKSTRKLKGYDIFLSIGGDGADDNFLDLLRANNPDIRCIKFLWDALVPVRIAAVREKYDDVFTFEKEDAVANGLKFRPSFYLPSENLKKKDVDCYYLGTLREKRRYNLIARFGEYCDKNGLKSRLRLYVRKNRMRPEHKTDRLITYKKISYKENINNVKRAKVVIELNYGRQKGLTLRTLECLDSRSKLITENADIKTYDFYHPSNIYVIEKEEDILDIPLSFFKEPYKDIDETIRQKYSFDGFIKEILGMQTCG